MIERNTTFVVDYQKTAPVAEVVQNDRPQFATKLQSEYTFDLYDESSLQDVSLGGLVDTEGDSFTVTA